MATKEKKRSPIRLWFLPVLFLLAAFPAFANIPRLAESRVWLPRDFAPLSIRAERDFSPETQGVFEGFNCELTLNPSIDPDGRCRTPLEGLDRMLSPYNFPGTPGTGYSLGAFNQIAGNDPSAYDEFDQMFARNIANGTSMYPYGYLGPEALQEAVNRGYVNDWDLPLIYSQDSHGTFVFKTGGQVVQDAFLAITTSAFLGAVTAEGSQAIESTIESTSRGAQPVFWSGGQTAEAAARTFANANNGIVIGDTVAGQELSAATEGVPWSQARPQWLQLSQNFANTASGEVNVFQNSQGVFLNSIWRDEYQTLINNPNVTGINFHVVMPNGSVVPVH